MVRGRYLSQFAEVEGEKLHKVVLRDPEIICVDHSAKQPDIFPSAKESPFLAIILEALPTSPST